MPQTHTPASLSGSFLAVPMAFEGTPAGLANALKVPVIPQLISSSSSSSSTAPSPGTPSPEQHQLNITTRTDHALIDFSAVDPLAIDFKQLQADCELMKESLATHRDALTQALKLVSSGGASPQEIEAMATALSKAGLTEQGFRERGGGLVGLVVVVVACLLVAGCRGCDTVDWAKRK